jgi:methionine-rich copper-binding protein CopC
MRGFLSTLAAAFLGLLILSTPVHAHTALEEAAPGPGDKVAPGASVVALTLKDLKPGTTPQVSVSGPDQSAVATGTPVMVDDSIVCASVAPLGPGVHSIVYTTVADDDDEQTSQYSFEVVAGAEAPVTPAACRTANLAAPGAAGPESTVLGLDRTTAVVVLAAVGVAVLLAVAVVVLGRGRGRRPGRRRRAAGHRA